MSRYTVIVWDNHGVRATEPAGDDLQQALAVARLRRTLANRTVKIGMAGNSIRHWVRSQHLLRNHWATRATADEWFV
ncbi:MAG: hypothetical protein N2483_10915 [Burkholderiaceae bacterium]|nr:hypothetical protein [Burkholderiaceae bacterium]